MLDRVTELLKIKNLTIPGLLFYSYKKINITLEELYFLIYLINTDDKNFDIVKFGKDLNFTNKEIFGLVNSLSEKDLVKLEVMKENIDRHEALNLEGLYKKLSFLIVEPIEKKEVVVSENLFDIFEKEFGRTLSPMEFEIINAWKESDFTDELILLGLKEATYNGACSLRYIDKVIHEWKKKGIKTKTDVEKQKQAFTKKPTPNVELEDYDWLNED